MSREQYLNQARAKAAKYCSLRERAPVQVMDKLLGWDLSEEEASHVLAQLIKEQFVDEERFCQAFCHDKFAFNHWGRVKIKQELFRYQLPETMVKSGLESINPKQYESKLKDLAITKWRSILTEKDLWVRRQKTTAYLIRKGFEMDLAIAIVNDLPDTAQ